MLLDYMTYLNVGGTADFLDKLRAWAVSKGWVQEEWRTEGMWVTGNWNSDVRGRFLTLSKSGYGSQSLICSIQILYNSYGCWGLMGGMRSQVAYDTGSSGLHIPARQYVLASPVTAGSSITASNSAGYHGGFDLTYDSTIPKVWFFAGTHWIAAVAQMNSLFCQCMHFGSFGMFEDNPTQGQVYGHYTHSASYGGYGENWMWSLYQLAGSNRVGPFSVSKTVQYANNASVGVNIRYNDRMQYPATSAYYIKDNCDISGPRTIGTPFLDVAGALKSNHYSAKRPLIKPIYFTQRPADSVWEPIAKAPIWFTRFGGLEIGQQLDFGSESYLVFPETDIYSTHGYAFRIS